MKQRKSEEITNENNIMAYIQVDSKAHPNDMSLEVISAARKLAEITKKEFDIVVNFQNSQEPVSKLANYGSTRLIVYVNNIFREQNLDATVESLTDCAIKYKPALFLFPGTLVGHEIAGRVAAKMDSPIFSNSCGFSFCKRRQKIQWEKSSFGGRLKTISEFTNNGIEIVTLKSRMFPQAQYQAYRAQILVESFSMPKDQRKSVFLHAVERKSNKGLAVENAEIIVAGGRGTQGKEGFDLVCDLAKQLGAAIGATRVAVDNGWAPQSCLIGQSGKIVHPRVYIACGISGSIQHMVGMRNADYIISINKDKEAMIFKISDFGIVGDLFKVLPSFIDEITKLTN